MSVDLKEVFIEEGEDLLSQAEGSLLVLEKDPYDEEALNSIFRVMHTFKGSAGMVGFEYIQSFTHEFESFLDLVRSHEIDINDNSISILLEAKDFLSKLIELIRQTGSDVDGDYTNEGDKILMRLKSISSRLNNEEFSDIIESNQKKYCSKQDTTWFISLSFHENFFYTGMDPYSFISYLSKLGKIVQINTFIRFKNDFVEFNPQNCYLDFAILLDTDFNRNDILDVFDFAQEDCDICVVPPNAKTEEYIKIINGLGNESELIGEILLQSGRITEKELHQVLEQQKNTQGKKIGEILVEEKHVSLDEINAAINKQALVREKKLFEQRSLKVDSEKLDRVINIVGELVTTTSGIVQKSKDMEDSQLDELSSNLQRLVDDLRDYSMELRMVPIEESFNKFKRLVRDLGKEFNKEIDLEIIGGETELDKTFIEKINDPMVHIIRNSIDHGIESIEERIKLGKNQKGRIEIKAYNESGSIVIEVKDDGRGLDKDRIEEKALNLGLFQTSQHLSDSEIYSFIFEPGFSTAKEITNFSGRGVGMDVVRRNIEELNGSVALESKKGEYTKVKITLPLTLAIIDGFLVEVSNQNYVIPLRMVVECIDATTSQINDQRHYVNLRGELLSFVDLHELFSLSAENKKHTNIVIVEHSDFKIGLVVDKIHGEVQAVIKSLGVMYKSAELFSGASILGDGSIALIINIEKMIKNYKENNSL
ncbi:MAG: chemotaxis protein CheA [Thermoplasmata archaeon]